LFKVFDGRFQIDQRTIIYNNDLKLLICLLGKGGQQLKKFVFSVVNGNDNGNSRLQIENFSKLLIRRTTYKQFNSLFREINEVGFYLSQEMDFTNEILSQDI
jgi:hypothetical protein